MPDTAPQTPDAAPQTGILSRLDELSPAQPEQDALSHWQGAFPDKVTTFVGNRRVDLPPEQAEKALRAGAVKIPVNQDIHVQLPDGSYKVVPPDQVNQALADGAHIASERAHHIEDTSAKYSGGLGAAIAGGAGLARGLSTVPGGGSFSDELFGSIPGGPEALLVSKQKHGLIGGGGEVLGMLGQAALMPGGGVANMAERGIASVAGEGLGGRVLSSAARAAIENAQLAHTEQVSEQALGAPAVTAEKYAAEELGALWQGAALGGGGTLLGAGARAALSKGSEAVSGLLRGKAAQTAIDDVAEKSFGYRTKESVGKALAGLQSTLSGADAEGRATIEKAGVQNLSAEAKKIRSDALNIADIRTQATKDLTEDFGTLLKKTEGLTAEVRGDLKLEKLKGLVESPLPKDELQAHAMDALQGVRNDISAMAQDTTRFGHARDLGAIDMQLQGFEKKMVSAVEKGDAADMYKVLDDTKREVGRWSQLFQRSSSQGNPLKMMQAKEVFAKLGDIDRGGGIYEELRKGLENEDVWGRAAQAQKALNSDWTAHIGASRNLERQASVTSVLGENNFGRRVYGVDPEKMAKYVGTLVDPSKDLAHQSMATYIDATKRLATTIGAHFDLPPEKLAAVRQVFEAAARMEQRLPEVADQIAHANQVETLVKAGQGQAGGMAAMVGHMIGGPVGALLGAAGGMAANPGKNIMRLAQLESSIAKFDAKMGSNIGRFFSRGEEGAAKVARKAAAKAASSETSPRAFFEKRTKVLKELGDPATLNVRMAAHHDKIQGAAPQTSQALGETAARAVAYLRAQMPEAMAADELLGKEGTPPLNEMMSFNLKAKAVENPAGVLEDMAKGRVTPEQVDAVRNVYPGIYQHMQLMVQQQLIERAKAGKPVSFQQRVNLGVLLNIDSDPSLSKGAMSHAMFSFASAPQPPDKAGGGGGKGGKSAQGARAATPEQKMSGAL